MQRCTCERKQGFTKRFILRRMSVHKRSNLGGKRFPADHELSFTDEFADAIADAVDSHNRAVPIGGSTANHFDSTGSSQYLALAVAG
ncbi:Uncharacterised protein [Mycobacteroides abscessus subsp. abscessus]|nr:Uncharacterised protein [Mycobacteroides abscessus subsp. abscessus]SKY99502.1 Uncharacterised protein [Mycobacteroides abscessus subsp. abscessus]